jgi:hypothetical protein
MTKKDRERAQRIFDLRRKGMKPGVCHCCGIFVTELTDEHAPPQRTQLLIPEKYLIRNPIGMIDEHMLSKRNLPPAVRGNGGFKFKTFCKVCQQKTQNCYGEASFQWVTEGLRLAQTVTDFDNTRVRESIRIQPLNVIKQMASNVLAVSRYSKKDYLKQKLQRFVQRPAAKGLPTGVRFLIYLNPIRPDYELPQCRFEDSQAHIDYIRSIKTWLVAEVAVPPFGVVTLDDADRIPPHLLPLMNVNHFGSFALDEYATIDLDLPVRTVFGPCPMRYWQDARVDSSFDAGEALLGGRSQAG